jgi:hypothetical protein
MGEILGKLQKEVLKPFMRLPWLGKACVYVCVAATVTAISDTDTSARWVDATKRLFRVAWSGDHIPLNTDARETLARYVKNKDNHLDSQLNQKSGKLAGQAWTSAQIILAIAPDREIDSAVAERFFYSKDHLGDDRGWRKFRRRFYPENVIVTASVVSALAALKRPARDAQIDFLLDEQAQTANRADGWWSVYPLPEGHRDLEFASTYATAAAALALHDQVNAANLQYRRDDAVAAIGRANNWLHGRLNVTSGRALDYPDGRELATVAGFTLHALHKTSTLDLTAFDRQWLKNLPPVPPTAADFESPVVTIFDGQEPIQTDDTRYYTLPLTIAAIRAAYGNGDWLGRAHALAWLERALEPKGIVDQLGSTKKTDWIAAELLVALRGL